MNRQDLEKAISDLEYLRAMMTFDPNTGEELNIENDNEDNKSLYRSAEIAIQTLQFELDKLDNKSLELSDIKEMMGKPVYHDLDGLILINRVHENGDVVGVFANGNSKRYTAKQFEKFYKYELVKNAKINFDELINEKR